MGQKHMTTCMTLESTVLLAKRKFAFSKHHMIVLVNFNTKEKDFEHQLNYDQERSIFF